MPSKNGKAVRFLLVTSSKLLQEGFKAIFTRLDRTRLSCVDGPEACLAHCLDLGPPDVLVVEPGMLDIMRACLRKQGWRCRAVVLWARPHSGRAQLLHAERLCGLLRICLTGTELDAMLQDVARCSHADPGSCGKWQGCPVRKTIRCSPLPLSRREIDVFRRLGHGQSVRHIAEKLSVSVKTIESHRENIKRKLDLDDAASLLEAAILWRRGEHVQPVEAGVDSAYDEQFDGRCLDDGDTLQL